MSAPDRRLPGWVLPAGLGVVVVALVAIALLRGPVSLDPDSPEGTVQEYLVAVDEQRWDEAIEVLHEDWRGSCEGTDLRASSPGAFTAELGSPDGFSGGVVTEEFIAIPSEDDVAPPTIPDDSTQVEVTINHTTGGGLGSSWSEYVVFELVDDGEFWWLVGNPWPYFVWSCQSR